MNAFSEGKSGGDVAFIQIFKRFAIRDLIVVTSFLGEKLCRESRLKAEFLISTSEKKFGNIFLIYFLRIIRATYFIFRTKPELIYSSSDGLPDVLPVFLYKIFNKDVKWIVKRYHDIPDKRLISFLMQKLSLLLIKFADLVIQNGKFGFDQGDIRKVLPAKAEYDAVFMSRLHESKGIFELVLIWKNVANAYPKVRLAIIGQGTQDVVASLNDSIQKVNMQNNIFIFGFLPEIKAYTLIKSAKLFLLPSHEEAFGLVLGEAMLCKTPIITYSLSALKWCRKYIFTVPCFEEEYFAKLIVKLLSDEKTRVRNVEKASEFVGGFTWDKAGEWEKKLIFNLKFSI
jgi:glycosyltransferase involved in cell wall biosynthesis